MNRRRLGMYSSWIRPAMTTIRAGWSPAAEYSRRVLSGALWYTCTCDARTAPAHTVMSLTPESLTRRGAVAADLSHERAASSGPGWAEVARGNSRSALGRIHPSAPIATRAIAGRKDTRMLPQRRVLDDPLPGEECRRDLVRQRMVGREHQVVPEVGVRIERCLPRAPLAADPPEGEQKDQHSRRARDDEPEAPWDGSRPGPGLRTRRLAQETPADPLGESRGRNRVGQAPEEGLQGAQLLVGAQARPARGQVSPHAFQLPGRQRAVQVRRQAIGHVGVHSARPPCR